MNTEKLKKLRDVVKDADEFCMDHFSLCGTPQCLAGHTCAMEGMSVFGASAAKPGGNRVNCPNTAAEILGLTGYEALDMFYQYGASRAEALAMLDTAIEHDEIRWPQKEEAS